VKSLRLLLFPLAMLYDIVTSVRNRLYDKGSKPVAEFDLPVIGVGNLAVGGTGKTPMVEYLIRLLHPPYKIATLSRGYGRKTKGFRVASAEDDASTLGDEPFQLYRKFHGSIQVAVGEERALAIPYIVDEFPETQIILMDDAFQHRSVKPSFQILLTDYNNLFFKDNLLPAGTLRESARGAQRADVIVVTKCPVTIKDDEVLEIEKSIRDYSQKPVFFSGIRYGNPIALDRAENLLKRVVLVSGIANHKPFENYVNLHYSVVKHFDFPDHHNYTIENLNTVIALAKKEDAMVIVTEKDAVKLNVPRFRHALTEVSFFYLPIEIEFLKNGKEFDEMLLNTLKQA
jgi:tetraacyldisaccharide 4'-kinase